jgi:hypothetical protein
MPKFFHQLRLFVEFFGLMMMMMVVVVVVVVTA